MNQDRTEAWVLQGLKYMYNHQARPPQVDTDFATAKTLSNSNKNRMAQIRDRLNLNLNDTNGNLKRKRPTKNGFNINMLRYANIRHNQEERRLSRLGLTLDLFMNPLSEDCVNPFSQDDFPINGR